MPTAEQNLKRALAEAKDNANAFDRLQLQIDAVVEFLASAKRDTKPRKR